MRRLGNIVRLQVQLDSIKSGKKPNERYTPEPNLTSVPVLRLNSDGVHGVSATGELLADVHNRTHPHSKFRGDNGVSVLFTGHYESMRNRFGDHLTDGIAGETILVEHDGTVTIDDISAGIVIRGGNREITIGPWEVAHPCAPFSKYCLQFPEGAKPDKRITETLQFLENGTRGFVAVYPDDWPEAEIHLGDEVYLVD